jgi:PPK2 family polyphosphate:nucleotide phosphotransferase
MANSPDLPELWTHEPRKVLEFKAGDKVSDVNPRATPGFTGSKNDAPDLLLERCAEYAGLQEMLYARSREGDKRSVLLVLQGMDTSGKGGITKHVVGAGNPQGIRYTSFGKPTEEEAKHHYLWRIRRALPPAGHIGVFDRSHYEDVLIVRVHNLVAPDVWEKRYEEINRFENKLVAEQTTVVKVALFISQDEQKNRLTERLERPDKYWKYNPADVDERLLWPKYMEAYQAVFDRCSTEHAPWYVVPADRKWYSRLAVTELLIEALTNLKLSWPPADFDVDAEKKRLAAT